MQTFDGITETTLRLSVFAGVFIALALLELVRPRRRLLASKAQRWLTNLSIVGLGILVGRGLGFILQSLTAVGAALLVAQNDWGLLNQVAWPAWIEILLAIIALDFAIWLQHVISHKVPVLWRLHRVHHADIDFDVTTALRFHPIEIGLSMLYKVVWVLLLGPAVVAVVLFEVLLNGCAMFNHANIQLPAWLDRVVRLVIVTPDMHRVHHSVIASEHSTNFGFNLSIWDRLFSTYTAQPQLGHTGMTIGLPDYQSPAPSRLGWSLWLPFGK
jgi:sterol desaturase/sphingolipid hydroxylase (fatty acid hydroxylase superfamily)